VGAAAQGRWTDTLQQGCVLGVGGWGGVHKVRGDHWGALLTDIKYTHFAGSTPLLHIHIQTTKTAADGRKVLRSSLREFMCSEFMHHLGVPTTRAGSLITSDRGGGGGGGGGGEGGVCRLCLRVWAVVLNIARAYPSPPP